VLDDGLTDETGWTVPSDTETDTATDTGTTGWSTWEGPEPQGGLGSTLVLAPSGVHAGAPWGSEGQVYLLGQVARPVYSGERPVSLGVGLAAGSDGTVVAGAPLAWDLGGHVLGTTGTDELGAPGDLLGARLAWADGVLWSTSGTTLLVDGEPTSLPDRPGDLVSFAGLPAVGVPRGGTALWLDGSTWARPTEHDEAGQALCAADLDGDGELDLAVGAPGAGLVHLLLGGVERWALAETVLVGPGGRFGQSLDCDDQTLVVGAPLAEGGLGAIWRFEGAPEDWDVEEPEAVGTEPSGHFGAAVLLDGTSTWVGAPMAGDGAGEVVRISP